MRALRSLLGGALLTAAALLNATALAHSASTAYLALDATQPDEVKVQWRIAARDVDALLDLDRNGDGHLTWGEVEDRRDDVTALLASGLALTGRQGTCAIAPVELKFIPLADAAYLQIDGRAQCADATALEYRLFQRIDPSHRVVTSLVGEPAPRLLAPGARLELASPQKSGTPDSTGATGSGFAHFVGEGIGHILSGVDHILFLVGLMLPAVLARRRVDGGTRWIVRDDLRAALLAVVGIVTAFTLAHSLTLAAATFGWVRIPASIIEPLIAATVLATALNNLWPVVTRRLWMVAFVFGLVHGFGFAEVLAPLELPPRELAFALAGFNLGVELGQLAIVAAAFGLLALARHWSGYVRVILQGGSAALAALAMVWVVERIGWITLPPLTGNG